MEDVVSVIIDMHVHLSKSLPVREWAWRQWPGTQQVELTAEQFIKKMDGCSPKINKSLVFGFRSLCSETPEIMEDDNNYILETVERYPDRYIGSAVIDPSWGSRAIKEMKRVIKAGLRVVKIKFTSMHFPANCPGAIKIFHEIDDLGVLPVIHSDWTHWSNPAIIGDLMSNFPDLKMVMQHFGLSQSLEALNVAISNENIYVDTSAVIHPRNIIRFIEKVGLNRIVYASDTIRVWEKTQPQEELDRVLYLNLPEEKNRKILGENARELLRSVGVRT